MDLNRVMIIGRLTRDPELRSIPSGQSVVTVGVATNRMWVDKSGQKQKQTEFHNVVFWSKLAEIISQYLKKGSKLYIEGRLQTREWAGQDGAKHTRTEIVAENMIMLDSRGPAEGGSAPRAAIPAESSGEEVKVEDIPF